MSLALFTLIKADCLSLMECALDLWNYIIKTVLDVSAIAASKWQHSSILTHTPPKQVIFTLISRDKKGYGRYLIWAGLIFIKEKKKELVVLTYVAKLSPLFLLR